MQSDRESSAREGRRREVQCRGQLAERFNFLLPRLKYGRRYLQQLESIVVLTLLYHKRALANLYANFSVCVCAVYLLDSGPQSVKSGSKMLTKCYIYFLNFLLLHF